MLKVSGEALAGPSGFGIDNEVVQAVAREVAIAVLSGVQVHALPPAPSPLCHSVFAGKGTPASADRMASCLEVTGSATVFDLAAWLHRQRCRWTTSSGVGQQRTTPRTLRSMDQGGHDASRTEYPGPSRHSRRPRGARGGQQAQCPARVCRSVPALPYALGSHQLSLGSSPHTHPLTHSHVHSLLDLPDGASWCRTHSGTRRIGCLETGQYMRALIPFPGRES